MTPSLYTPDMRATIGALLILFVVSCSSSSRNEIFRDGFSAQTISDATYHVSFDNERTSSEDEARANLMYHAARWTLEHGGVYFTLEDVDAARSRTMTRESSASGVPPEMTPDSGAVIAPSGMPESSQTSGVSFGSRYSASGLLTIHRELPTTGTVHEASRVLDELGPMGSSRKPRASVGVGN